MNTNLGWTPRSVVRGLMLSIAALVPTGFHVNWGLLLPRSLSHGPIWVLLGVLKPRYPPDSGERCEQEPGEKSKVLLSTLKIQLLPGIFSQLSGAQVSPSVSKSSEMIISSLLLIPPGAGKGQWMWTLLNAIEITPVSLKSEENQTEGELGGIKMWTVLCFSSDSIRRERRCVFAGNWSGRQKWTFSRKFSSERGRWAKWFLGLRMKPVWFVGDLFAGDLEICFKYTDSFSFFSPQTRCKYLISEVRSTCLLTPEEAA